jgi:hypothetical protein
MCRLIEYVLKHACAQHNHAKKKRASMHENTPMKYHKAQDGYDHVSTRKPFLWSFQNSPEACFTTCDQPSTVECIR